MTKHTKRDRVWDAALRLAERGKFTIGDVLDAADLPASSERTARDTLTTMVELGHLEQGSWSPDHASPSRRCWYGARIDYSDMEGYEEKAVDVTEEYGVEGGERVIWESPPWANGEPSVDEA
jgi:hypothetical protein